MKRCLLYLMIITHILLMNSCKDDKDENRLEEDKESLMNLPSDLLDNLETFAGSGAFSGMKSLTELMEIHDPLAGPDISGSVTERYMQFLIPSNDSLLPTKSSELEFFVFDEKTGTYTWNTETQDWDIELNDTSIIMIFPTGGSGSASNDAILTIHEFEYRKVYYYWHSWVQPLIIKADLVIAEEMVFEAELKYTYKPDNRLSRADISIMLLPFNLKLNFADTGASYKFGMEVSANDKTFTSAKIELGYTYAIDDWDNEITVITIIKGYLHYLSLKLSGSVNIAAFDEIEELTVNDINTHVNLVLERHPGGKKIADIDFIESESDNSGTDESDDSDDSDDSDESDESDEFWDYWEFLPRLVFTDGSTLLVKDFIITTEIELRLQEMMKEWQVEEGGD